MTVERTCVEVGNLFRDMPGAMPDELFTALVERPGMRIERIVSSGHETPQGEWYDQNDHEWVMLVRGAARLDFEDGKALDMGPGDHVLIPAHCRHRVAWTSPGEPTVWLAVHFAVGNGKSEA